MNLKHLFSLFIIALQMTACAGNSTAGDSRKADQEKATTTAFSGDSAYNFVARQVAFGKRVPGTVDHRNCGDWIADKLRSYGGIVTITDTVVTNVEGKRVPVRNISATFHPDAPKRVLLAAHYDTRPMADHDPDPANHNKPIDGANDGASGVAVLLEIARNINEIPDKIGVEMLFVDTEDSGSYDGDDATWCVGSQVWAASRKPSDPRINYGILLDMVGGRDARFHREYFSELKAPQVNERLRRAARRLGVSDRFPNEFSGAINDDHIYLMQAGFPMADIIEAKHPVTGSFPPYWHTLDDTLDNIDPATLKVVGDVVITTLKNS